MPWHITVSSAYRITSITIFILLGHARYVAMIPEIPVYQYVWRDYGQPTHRGLVLTLNDKEIIPFMAFITILITYTQTRTWKLLRYHVQRLTSPIHLPDDEESTSLSYLYQGAANR